MVEYDVSVLIPISMVMTAIITGVYAWSTHRIANHMQKQSRIIEQQFEIMRDTLRDSGRSSLDAIRTQHNWNLIKHGVDSGLPGLPSKKDPNFTEYFNWRIVHFDHLSLLQTEWIKNNEKIPDDWKNWIHFLLVPLQEDFNIEVEENSLSGLSVEDQAKELANNDKLCFRLRALFDIAFKHNWDLYPEKFVDDLLHQCDFESIGLPSKHSVHNNRNSLCEICKRFKS